MKKARERHFEKEPEFWTILKGTTEPVDWYQIYLQNERIARIQRQVIDELLGRQSA